MHADEVPIDLELVRRLIANELPEWSGREVVTIDSGGTDNAMFRLGDDLVVRIPRIPASVARLAKECEWLPRFADLMPVAIPRPVAQVPGTELFPLPWSVYEWIDGAIATQDRLVDPDRFALELAEFLDAVHRVDPTGGPQPGEHNSYRGLPLESRDAGVRAGLAQLEGVIDVAPVEDIWQSALAAPAWSQPGQWIHGDIWETNLLVDAEGHLTAVIDFGCLGVGDPAVDLTGAWNLFESGPRATFREAMEIDEATWDRGRGWALSMAVMALPYYRDTNPVIVANAERMLERILIDQS